MKKTCLPTPTFYDLKNKYSFNTKKIYPILKFIFCISIITTEVIVFMNKGYLLIKQS